MFCKTRRNFTDEAYRTAIRKGLGEWLEKADVVYTWEYYNPIFDNPAWMGYPTFFPGLITEDLRWLRGKSPGEFIEAESWTPRDYSVPGKTKINFPGFQHLDLYLTAKLLWNPDLSHEELLGEYYQLFYGQAASVMEDFWGTVAEAWASKGTAKTPHEVYKSHTLQRMSALLVEALSKVPESSDYFRRIKMIQDEFKPVSGINERLEALDASVLIPGSLSGDGSVTAEQWDEIPAARFLDRLIQPSRPSTTIKAVVHNRQLLLRVVCMEPEMASARRETLSDDQSSGPAMWEDDSVEFFFAPPEGNGIPALQIVVSLSGRLLDAERNANGTRFAHQTGAKAHVTADSGSWTIDLAIPLEDLPLAGQNCSLRVNFFRNRFAGGEAQQSSWAPLLGGPYFMPEHFGILKLPTETGLAGEAHH
jgi:hypothetical protein